MASIGFNAAFALASNALGIRLDPYQTFNFFVEIDSILVGGFSECSGLQVEVEVETYPEGGVNDYLHHFKGRAKYPPLTLKHGLTFIEGLWSWHQDVIKGEFERHNGTIYLLNSKHIPVLWWNFKEAFPTKWTGPDLRADSGTVAFESVELVHNGLSRPKMAGVLAGLGASLL
jgi:phage tail-like protein